MTLDSQLSASKQWYYAWVSGQETPSTHPKAFGGELRQLREAAGLSLDDIVLETKISRRILESLEAGKFQYLPERVFSRNFVRQYARLIRTDEERCLTSFEAAWQQFLIASGSHSYQLVTETPQRVIRWYFWVPISVTILIFLAISVVIIQGPKRPSELPSEPRRATDDWTATAALDTGEAQLPVSEVASSDATGQPANTDTVLLRVRTLPEKDCWIEYRDHEGRTGKQLLHDGSSFELEIEGPTQLMLGNAGAATVQVGDKEYRNLGPPGHVVRVEVTRDGVVQSGAGERRD